MTTSKLLAYWPASLARAMRQWLLRRRLVHIRFALAHIEQQEVHNRHAKRYLQGQQALIQSELRM
jgi:hypothetical protein